MRAWEAPVLSREVEPLHNRFEAWVGAERIKHRINPKEAKPRIASDEGLGQYVNRLVKPALLSKDLRVLEIAGVPHIALHQGDEPIGLRAIALAFSKHRCPG